MKRLIILSILAAIPAFAQQPITLDLGSIELSQADVKILLASPSIQSRADPNPDDDTPATRGQVAQFLRAETRRVLKHHMRKARAEAVEANTVALPATYKDLVDQLESLTAQIEAFKEADPTEN